MCENKECPLGDICENSIKSEKPACKDCEDLSMFWYKNQKKTNDIIIDHRKNWSEFGKLEFKLKCCFCDKESDLFTEKMGYSWDKSWTCPTCGIRYRMGKSYWGGARCLYLTINEGTYEMFDKTAELERLGNKYNKGVN